MKKATYSVGIVALLSIVGSVLFKKLHLQGAEYVLLLATVSTLIFVPLYAFYRYKKSKKE